MPFNGSGTFTRVMDWTNDRDAQIKIRADRHDQNDDDIAAGLSQTITRDGQSQITSNIPFNGKKITNLAQPVDPQDAATKSYADAIRSFPTPIIIAGSDANGRLRFTGSQTDATVASANPLGIEFQQADLFFGVRRYVSAAAPNRFAWNASADGSGVELMTLWEDGTLNLGGAGIFNFTTATPAIRAAGVAAIEIGATYVSSVGTARNLAVTTPSGGAPAIVLFATGRSIQGMYNAPDGFLRLSSFTDYTVAASEYLRLNSTSAVFPAHLDTAGSFQMTGPTMWLNRSGDFFLTGQATIRQLQFYTGYSVDWMVSSGDLRLLQANTASLYLTASNKQMTLYGPAYKPGGGPFLDSSDARIKNVLGEYEGGLAQIKALVPKRFTYKGNETVTEAPHGEPIALPQTKEERTQDDGPPPNPDVPEYQEGVVPYVNSPHYQAATEGMEFVGLIAQEVEPVMPNMVIKRAGWIDGEEVTDLHDLDTTNLIFAVINAIKTLDQRLAAVEGA